MRLATNPNATRPGDRLRAVLSFYTNGAEWFAAHPEVGYCSDTIMARLYAHWSEFSDTARYSRRTEWNSIRIVAQSDIKRLRALVKRATTKAEFLREVTALKRQVSKRRPTEVERLGRRAS